MRYEHSNHSPALFAYMESLAVKESPHQKSLRDKTSHLDLAIMQISPIQGQFIHFMIKLINAKKCLELGTFTGYSALTIAEALPDDGHLITCDINEDWTTIAKGSWKEANVDHKITLKLGPATDTLETLTETDKQGFDFVFIDADKTNYLQYYQATIELTRPGGLIIIDNIFWDDKVIDPAFDDDRQTAAVKSLNDYVSQDSRVESTIVPIADGLYLIKVL